MMAQKETPRPVPQPDAAQNKTKRPVESISESRRLVSALPRLRSAPQVVYQHQLRGLEDWHHWHQHPRIYPVEALTEKDSGVGFHKPDDLGLWSPADFREDEHGNRARRNNNVDSVSFLVFDVDEGELCRKEILDVLSGLRASLMPSFNFSNATPKYRIVLDISRRISAEEFTRIMPLASTILEGQGIAPDPAALDAARLFYDSAIPDSNEHLWFADLTEGTPLDIDEILAIAPPAPPERVFEPSSAPLFQSVLGILLSEAGMVLQDKTERAEILCPRGDEHTDGKLDGAVLFPPQVGSELGYIHCRHTHCENRPVSSFLSYFPQPAIDAARAKLKATDL